MKNHNSCGKMYYRRVVNFTKKSTAFFDGIRVCKARFWQIKFDCAAFFGKDPIWYIYGAEKTDLYRNEMRSVCENARSYI